MILVRRTGRNEDFFTMQTVPSPAPTMMSPNMVRDMEMTPRENLSTGAVMRCSRPVCMETSIMSPVSVPQYMKSSLMSSSTVLITRRVCPRLQSKGLSLRFTESISQMRRLKAPAVTSL